MNCPYGQQNDRVQMIGHNNEGIQFHVGITQWQVLPTSLNNLAKAVQLHRTVANFPQEVPSVVGAKGDKICSGLGVIVFLKTD